MGNLLRRHTYKPGWIPLPPSRDTPYETVITKSWTTKSRNPNHEVVESRNHETQITKSRNHETMNQEIMIHEITNYKIQTARHETQIWGDQGNFHFGGLVMSFRALSGHLLIDFTAVSQSLSKACSSFRVNTSQRLPLGCFAFPTSRHARARARELMSPDKIYSVTMRTSYTAYRFTKNIFWTKDQFCSIVSALSKDLSEGLY